MKICVYFRRLAWPTKICVYFRWLAWPTKIIVFSSVANENPFIFVDFIPSAYFHGPTDEYMYFQQFLGYFRRFMADEINLFSCSDTAPLFMTWWHIQMPTRPGAQTHGDPLLGSVSSSAIHWFPGH
jgi:hypothetical protein